MYLRSVCEILIHGNLAKGKIRVKFDRDTACECGDIGRKDAGFIRVSAKADRLVRASDGRMN